MPRVDRRKKPLVVRSHTLWLGAFRDSQKRYVITDPDGDGDVHLLVGHEGDEKALSVYLTPAQARKLGMLLLEVSDE